MDLVTYIVYILSRKKIKGIILQKIFYSIPSVDFMRDGFAQSTKVLFRSNCANIYFISNELLRILLMNTCAVNFQKLKTVILNFEYDILSSLLIYQHS